MKMKISGTGSALPRKIVTNDMLAQFLDTSDEWIRTRTGVTSRHVISDEKLEDLAREAAEKASTAALKLIQRCVNIGNSSARS